MIVALRILANPVLKNGAYGVRVWDIIRQKTRYISTSKDSLLAQKHFKHTFNTIPVQIGEVIFLNRTPQHHHRLARQSDIDRFYNKHLEYFI